MIIFTTDLTNTLNNMANNNRPMELSTLIISAAGIFLSFLSFIVPIFSISNVLQIALPLTISITTGVTASIMTVVIHTQNNSISAAQSQCPTLQEQLNSLSSSIENNATNLSQINQITLDYNEFTTFLNQYGENSPTVFLQFLQQLVSVNEQPVLSTNGEILPSTLLNVNFNFVTINNYINSTLNYTTDNNLNNIIQNFPNTSNLINKISNQTSYGKCQALAQIFYNLISVNQSLFNNNLDLATNLNNVLKSQASITTFLIGIYGNNTLQNLILTFYQQIKQYNLLWRQNINEAFFDPNLLFIQNFSSFVVSDVQSLLSSYTNLPINQLPSNLQFQYANQTPLSLLLQLNNDQQLVNQLINQSQSLLGETGIQQVVLNQDLATFFQQLSSNSISYEIIKNSYNNTNLIFAQDHLNVNTIVEQANSLVTDTTNIYNLLQLIEFSGNDLYNFICQKYGFFPKFINDLINDGNVNIFTPQDFTQIYYNTSFFDLALYDNLIQQFTNLQIIKKQNIKNIDVFCQSVLNFFNSFSLTIKPSITSSNNYTTLLLQEKTNWESLITNLPALTLTNFSKYLSVWYGYSYCINAAEMLNQMNNMTNFNQWISSFVTPMNLTWVNNQLTLLQ